MFRIELLWDIVYEVACWCGDKQDRSQTAETGRKHLGKFMAQSEETVRKHRVPYVDDLFSQCGHQFLGSQFFVWTRVAY